MYKLSTNKCVWINATTSNFTHVSGCIQTTLYNIEHLYSRFSTEEMRIAEIKLHITVIFMFCVSTFFAKKWKYVITFPLFFKK